MIPIPKATSPPKIDRISLKDWLKGTVTAFDDGRTPITGLRASGNVILDQDGTIRPRPSLIRYGTQPTGTILGELFEFVQTTATGTVNWIGCLQNVAGVTKFYISKDGAVWQICNGKSFDNTALAHFCQIDNKVLILNGTDNLAYFDITTAGAANTVVPFVALSTPGAPTIARTGLAGTTFTYYYKVTANSTVGETIASTETSQGVDRTREKWDSTSNFLTISWGAVASAVSYNVYVSNVSGQEVLVAANINALSFKDDGSLALNVAITAPSADTTAGPICTRATVINGQVFMTGDKNNSRYVRFGGVGQSVLDFGPFNGGGWVELGRGTKETPVKVVSFRDGRGNALITVLCRGTNGSGKRYTLNPDSVTIGTTIINFFDVTEDNGQSGTDSPDGVVLYRDSVFYPSRDGFKTTGTKPQLQNILSTTTISETIINDIKNLSSQYMDRCMGLAFQERIYWAVPVGSSTNNEIWVLDLARGGAWMKPWGITASWMSLYNDNTGATHHLVVGVNNVIYELSYGAATTDDTAGFSTNATSGFIKFSDDGLEWAKVIDVTFVLLRPQGTINFTLSGKTEDSSLQAVGATSFIASSTVAGWGEAGWGGSPDLAKPQIFGWSNFSVIPVAFGDAQRLVTIEVDEELEWLQWELDTSGTGVDYQLADVIVRYVKIGVKDLT